MEESYPAGRLCYPGKAVELRFGREHLPAHVAAVDESGVRLSERVTGVGGCEVVIIFLGEHYQGRGSVITGDDGASVVLIEEGFRSTNARSAPRVAVDLAGAYYLRPPTLGVPMRVVDISVSGLVIEPVAGQRPMVDEHRMCGFGVEGREIKAIIEFVEITDELWRARFVKLGLSDEEAIASFVLSRQLSQRRQLSPLEVRTLSSLDVEDRLRYPLVERIDVGATEVTFVAYGGAVVISRAASEPLEPFELTGLVGWLRCGDLRDLNHALGFRGLGENSVDLVLTGCLALAALLAEVPIAELLARLIDIDISEGSKNLPVPPYLSMETLDPKELSAGTELVESSGRCWVQRAYAAGVALYLPDEESELQGLGRVDPLTMAQMVRGSEGQILLVPRWGAHDSRGVSAEIYLGYRALAAGQVFQLPIDD